MKPLYLAIEGMHSFVERQEVHFDQLADMGMFGIFGPTGSGKSTILDAITLALYGKVGRAAHGTHGILNHASDRLEVIYEFELWSENGPKRYRIERRYHRRDEQRSELRVCRLLDVSSNGAAEVMGDKVTDVENAIRNLIGLTMEDFTKAVVLPQGKFAELLQMKPAERKSMLERLFGLEKYGARLRAFVGQRLEAVRKDLSRVEESLVSLGDASPEVLAQTAQQLELAQEAEHRAKQAADEADHRFAAMSATWELQRQLSLVTAQVAEHKAKETEFISIKTSLAASERAAKVVKVAAEAEQQAANFAQHEQIDRQLKGEADRLEAELYQAEQAYEQARMRYAAEQPPLIALKAKLDEARDVEHQLEAARASLRPLRTEYEALQTDLQGSEAAHQQMQEEAARTRDELTRERVLIQENRVEASSRTQVGAVRSKVDALGAAYGQLQQRQDEWNKRKVKLDQALRDLEQARRVYATEQAKTADYETSWLASAAHKPTDENELTARAKELEQLRAIVRSFQQFETDRAQVQQRESQLQDELSQARRQLQMAEQAEHDAKQQVQQWEAVLKARMERLHQNQAALLATELVAGIPCPVCGSTTHPKPALVGDGELEAAAAQAGETDAEYFDREWRTAQDQAQVKAGQAMDWRTRIATLVGQGEAVHHQREQASSAMKDAQAKLPASFAYATPGNNVSNSPDSAGMLTVLAQIEQTLSADEATLKQWSLQREETRMNLESARSQMAATATAMSVAETYANLADKEWQGAHGRVRDQEDAVRTAALSVQPEGAEAFIDAGVLLREATHWVQSAEEEIHRKDELVGKAEPRIQNLDNLAVHLERQVREAGERQSALGASVNKAFDVMAIGESRILDLEHRVAAVTGGLSVSSMMDRTEDQLRGLETERTAAEEKRNLISHQCQTTRQEFTAQRTRLITAREVNDRALVMLQQVLTVENFVTVAAAMEARLTESESAAWEARVRQFEAQEKQLAGRQQHVLEQLGENRVAQEQWVAAQGEAEEWRTKWKEAVEGRAGLETIVKDLKERHERWLKLKEQELQFGEQERLVREIASLLSGNAFVGFLAAEHMEFVAHAASDMFQKLSSNKFALEVDSEGGFLVRDDFNAGKRRAVSSLSGGEMFQAALSLALALSTHIQLRGNCPLELFFLDEGFGTLDPERLDKVMTSLETLQHGSMTIGIISHVPELRQRMPRRLLVEPAQANGRGSQVRIERL